MRLKLLENTPRRVLNFDIENRPLSYRGQFPTADITAIAAGWIGEEKVDVRLLGVHDAEEMLSWILGLYDQADMVVGHYIRRHDLPILNGALMECGLPTLSPKLTQDTYLDLVRRKDLPASQEDLSQMLGVVAPKVSMSQTDWRKANRLSPEGIEETRRRVVGDVYQNKQLREALLERKLLKPPKVWKP